MRLKVAVLALALMAVPAWAAATPEGLWAAGDNGESKIRIEPCGEALCGTIVWLAEPNEANGQPKIDSKNPDPALRNQPLIGTMIIKDLKPSASKKGQWDGQIYNPEDGNTYSVYVRPNGGSLDVQGCLTIFCQTKNWPKAEE
ncbi:MAG: DUF2147 domain-containing protein [Hyphomicrobiales bacterium]